MLKPTIINGRWVWLPPPPQDQQWLSRQSDLNANNPVKAAMTRLYRYRNGLLEAAWADDPERWSVLLLPSLHSMTPEELRHVAGVIDEGRAKMEAGGD